MFRLYQGMLWSGYIKACYGQAISRHAMVRPWYGRAMAWFGLGSSAPRLRGLARFAPRSEQQQQLVGPAALDLVAGALDVVDEVGVVCVVQADGRGGDAFGFECRDAPAPGVGDRNFCCGVGVGVGNKLSCYRGQLQALQRRDLLGGLDGVGSGRGARCLGQLHDVVVGGALDGEHGDVLLRGEELVEGRVYDGVFERCAEAALRGAAAALRGAAAAAGLAAHSARFAGPRDDVERGDERDVLGGGGDVEGVAARDDLRVDEKLAKEALIDALDEEEALREALEVEALLQGDVPRDAGAACCCCALRVLRCAVALWHATALWHAVALWLALVCVLL